VFSFKPQEKAGVHYLRAICSRKLWEARRSHGTVSACSCDKMNEMLADRAPSPGD
jgi:hypothetical protein